MGKLIWIQFKNSHYSVIVQVEPKSVFVFLKTQMQESSLLLIFVVLNMLLHLTTDTKERGGKMVHWIPGHRRLCQTLKDK